MKNKLPDWLFPALVIAAFFAVLAFFGGAEEEFKKRDPEGYERYMETVREEGIPDPRR